MNSITLLDRGILTHNAEEGSPPKERGGRMNSITLLDRRIHTHNEEEGSPPKKKGGKTGAIVTGVNSNKIRN